MGDGDAADPCTTSLPPSPVASDDEGDTGEAGDEANEAVATLPLRAEGTFAARKASARLLLF